MHKLFIIALTFVLHACATVFSDTSDLIQFTSVPEGADVFVNGHKIGQTPLSEKFDRDTFAKSLVQVKLDGHEEQRFTLQKSLNKIALINFTFWPSWATDALSGSMIQYSPNSYHVFLKRDKLSSKDQNNQNDQRNYEEQKKIQDFVLRRYSALQADVAKGDGESLKTLWQIQAKNKMSYTDFRSMIQGKTKDLLETKRPIDFYLILEEIVKHSS